MELIRSFVAVELDPHTLKQLAALQEQLKAQIPSGLVRWVNPQGIHLTLKFLGEVKAPKLEAVKGALEKVCSRYQPFTFSYGGLGCFPSTNRPNVIWVGVEEPSGTLLALQKEVEDALARLGFKPENKAFSPHLTLGRVGRRVSGAERRKLGERIRSFEAGTMGQVKVEMVSLMRSDLKPSGAVYTRLASFPLGGER
ncbi:MAG TPA: RNA 2',3'-cyclic phosphodiesterase [Chloroflexi bacterium]|nr:RNA 2',3'-cyclic phosphodiesterase [Chloroflexota bacterium]